MISFTLLYHFPATKKSPLDFPKGSTYLILSYKLRLHR
nr:MAG TPA: hypothetical protein [Caudoviricetes sp.]